MRKLILALIVAATVLLMRFPINAMPPFFLAWSAGGNCQNEGNIAAGSTNYLSCSSSISVTAGDLIVMVTGNTASKTMIGSDNDSNIYTQIATVTGGRPSIVNILTAVASTTNAALTPKTRDSASAATGSVNIGAAAFTWSGGGLTGAADACNTATGSALTVNVTLSAATDLVIGSGDGSGTIGAGTGFTLDGTPTTGGTTKPVLEHATSLTSTIGSNTVAYTATSGGHGAIGCGILAGSSGATKVKRRVIADLLPFRIQGQ